MLAFIPLIDLHVPTFVNIEIRTTDFELETRGGRGKETMKKFDEFSSVIKIYISEYFICQISKNEFSVIIVFLWIKPVLGRVFEFICSRSGRSNIQVVMRESCMFVYCHN